MIVDHETHVESLKNERRSCAVRAKIQGTLYQYGPMAATRLWDMYPERYHDISIILFTMAVGGMIEGHVTDLTKIRSPIPAGGTEIKLKLFFRHTSTRLKSYVDYYLVINTIWI